MRVDGIVFASARLMGSLKEDQGLQQGINVATLPGIVKASYAMPDIHWGYGFPIGGVAAFDPDEGVVSPGGVGYDINCGVRLLRTDLEKSEGIPRIKELVEQLYRRIPSGMGAHRKDLRLTGSEVGEVLKKGAGWGVERGFGWGKDLERIESGGTIPGADPSAVSERAIERGKNQVGTLGSGNHFIEVEYVEEIYDPAIAAVFGLFKDQICIHIHSGSRGLGYQVCDDSIEVMLKASQKYGIELDDRQPCAAPLSSPEAKRYLGAMAAAANYAFCNRQLMAHAVRESFERFFGRSSQELGMQVVYDLAHNIAKFEEHVVDGTSRRLCVHRKGATRAFAAGMEDLPAAYRETGQPVIIGGTMGTASHILVGTAAAEGLSFSSSCHGAGRSMSRHEALKRWQGKSLIVGLAGQGILIRTRSYRGAAEEAPGAYKDVDAVAEAADAAGFSRKVAKLTPLICVKG